MVRRMEWPSVGGDEASMEEMDSRRKVSCSLSLEGVSGVLLLIGGTEMELMIVGRLRLLVVVVVGGSCRTPTSYLHTVPYLSTPRATAPRSPS